MNDFSLNSYLNANYPYNEMDTGPLGLRGGAETSHLSLNQTGRGLSNVIDWAKLPPGLGFADTVTYQRGVPQRDNQAGLMANWTRLAVLTPFYLALAQAAPAWAIPAWSGLLAVNEARRSQDALSQGQNALQAAVPVLAGAYAGVPLGQLLAYKLADRENQNIYGC